ncbi:MAG: hypothetical protein N3H31_02190 [Candidatus Nezhaarchaeota archaeon]|nr:hypothetical protein [Candidatus Nezhaarchaeota archaeon]
MPASKPLGTIGIEAASGGLVLMKLFRRSKGREEGKRGGPQVGVSPAEPPAPPTRSVPEVKVREGLSVEASLKSLSQPSLSLLRDLKARGASDRFIDLVDAQGLDLKLVEDLHKKGLVEVSVSSRVLKCPKCSSSRVRTFYACPHCRSREVNKGTLYTHQACGSFFTEAKVEGEKFYCPVCGSELKEESYSVVGAWFECEKCGRGFEEPTVNFTCSDCLSDFDVRSSRYEKVVAVKLTSHGEDALHVHDLLNTVCKVASEEGYQASTFTTLTGLSGIAHEFDAVLVKEGREKAISILRPSEAKDVEKARQSIIPLLAKSYDLPRGSEILLISNNANLDAQTQRLLEQYNIKLVEGRSEEEVAESIRKSLRGEGPGGGRAGGSQ